MKKIFFIILSLVQLSTFAQGGFNKPREKIQTSDLTILQTGTQNSIKLYDSKKAIIKAFGKPLEIKKSYFIKFDFPGEEVKYNGAAFYFMGGNFVAFEITNNKFNLKIKSVNELIIVGNFLKAFKRHDSKYIDITLWLGDMAVDKVLGIDLNALNKVTYIVCGPD